MVSENILRSDLLELLKSDNVIRFGDFTLSSGKKSDYYVDIKKAITNPIMLQLIANIIDLKIKDDNIDKIAGPALGAIPLATAVSLKSNKLLLMIRKEKKSYGTSKLIEGELIEGDNVIVLEDVITTGNSLLKAINSIKSNGGVVKRVFVVVDRCEGAVDNFAKLGISLEPLLSVNDFK